MINSTGTSKSYSGVTLMELIIVIAIISILVMVAYPSYERSKTESRRSDATGAVVATQGVIERYLVENNKALFGSSDLSLSRFTNYSVASGTHVFSKNGDYIITIVTDSNGYTINATATATGSLNDCATSGNEVVKQCRDTLCRVISLDHGQRKSTDSSGAVSNEQATKCW